MTFPRARMVVAAVLFLGWLAYLLFLVIETPTTIVSRPQVLAASASVTADIREERGRPIPVVKVIDVLGPAAFGALAGTDLSLPELALYRKEQGYEGPGRYVLPISKFTGENGSAFIVTPIPRLRGYPRPKEMFASVELIKLPVDPENWLNLAATLFASATTPVGGRSLLVATICLPGVKSTAAKVTRCLVDEGGMSKKAADAAIAQWERHPDEIRTLLRRIPMKDAMELQVKLDKLGAWTRVIEEDVRIYPLTAETRGQVIRTLTH